MRKCTRWPRISNVLGREKSCMSTQSKLRDLTFSYPVLMWIIDAIACKSAMEVLASSSLISARLTRMSRNIQKGVYSVLHVVSLDSRARGACLMIYILSLSTALKVPKRNDKLLSSKLHYVIWIIQYRHAVQQQMACTVHSNETSRLSFFGPLKWYISKCAIGAFWPWLTFKVSCEFCHISSKNLLCMLFRIVRIIISILL